MLLQSREAAVAAILILGEHDKGLGEPFSSRTVSGRRLRGLIAELRLNADLGNVFDYRDGALGTRDLTAACSPYSTVIAVGRTASGECTRQGIRHVYLPHPAVRSKTQLNRLRAGLAQLNKERTGTHGSTTV